MRIFFLLYVSLVTSSFATELPNVGKFPWYKTYNGFSYKNVDMLLDTSGEFKVFPKIEEKRVSESYVITINFLLEYKEKNSDKWVKRKVKEFYITEGAKAPREIAEVVTTVTGDVRFKLKIEHDKKGVNLSAEFVETPDYSSAKYRLSIVSEVSDLYGIGVDDRKSAVSSKLRGDGITIFPVHEKEVRKKKFKLQDEIDLTPYQSAGIKTIRLDANRYGKSDIYWYLLDGDKGTLDLELKNPEKGGHKGFRVSTILVDQIGELRSKGLRLEVK